MKVEDLIEELEGIRARLQPRALSPEAYQAVGWADRPLRHLLDQCRQEQEAQSWAEKYAREFIPTLGQDLGTELSAVPMLPEPLPMRSMLADGLEASP
jgi:hypothetical protein